MSEYGVQPFASDRFMEERRDLRNLENYINQDYPPGRAISPGEKMAKLRAKQREDAEFEERYKKMAEEYFED